MVVPPTAYFSMAPLINELNNSRGSLGGNTVFSQAPES